MGTHSIIYVVDERLDTLCTIYTQYDGYPQEGGKGWYLYNFLCNRKIINGFNSDNSYLADSNGIDDLAAQLVWYLKDTARLGSVYLYPAPKRPTEQVKNIMDYIPTLMEHAHKMSGEYMYIITVNADGLLVFVYDLWAKSKPCMFAGKPEMLKYMFGYLDCSNVLSLQTDKPSVEA